MMNNTKVMIRGVGLCTVQDSRQHHEKGLQYLLVSSPNGSESINVGDFSLIQYSIRPLYFTYTMQPSESPYYRGKMVQRKHVAHYSLVDALKYMRRHPGSQLSIYGTKK